MNYTGDGTLLGDVSRTKVIYQLKKGIQQFNFNALGEIKGCELELNDTLSAVLPPNFVRYVRLSWVNPETGDLMVLSKNDNIAMYNAYLQDNDAQILFDGDGNILEGTTYFQTLNDRPPSETEQLTLRNFVYACGCGNYYGCNCGTDRPTLWGLDTSKNINGTFNIYDGKIHFSSDNLTRVIMLEYISDGLEYSNEDEIRVNKLAEIALYNWCNTNLLSTMKEIPMYEKKHAKNLYDTTYRNAKVYLKNIKASDVCHLLNLKYQWLNR